MDRQRTGADAFVQQLIAGGVRWIFGNPGTTEQSVIDCLQEYPEISFVLALHEGVAVCAAEGFARASGQIGVVELHAGPGLGNGLGMIYNACKGQTPLLVYVGQCEQASLYQEPVLSEDLVALAKPLTKWAYQINSPGEIPSVVQRAIKVATTKPYGPVLLALPIDIADGPCPSPTLVPNVVSMEVRPDPDAVRRALDLIIESQSPALIVGDGVVRSGARGEVQEFAKLIGAPVFEGTLFETCLESSDPLRAPRLPQNGPGTLRLLEPYDLIVGIGTKVLAQIFPNEGPPLETRQVVHFGLDAWELGKNQTSTIVFGNERVALRDVLDQMTDRLDSKQRRRFADRLVEVSERLRAARDQALVRDQEGWDDLPMSPERAIAEIGAALPKEVIVVDESLTAFSAVSRYIDLRPGKWYRGRGGGIGTSLPAALGVQAARPDEKVIAFVGDGSALYSITALWSASHHRLPVTWVVLNNESYRILKENTLARRPSFASDRGFVGADLTDPPFDFVAVARGMGVDARRVEVPSEIASTLAWALNTPEPTLIDLKVSGEFRPPG